MKQVFTTEFKLAVLETLEMFTDEKHPGLSSERIANTLQAEFPAVSLDAVKLCAKSLGLRTNRRSGLQRPDNLPEAIEFLKSIPTDDTPTIPSPPPTPPQPIVPQNDSPSLLGVILPAG